MASFLAKIASAGTGGAISAGSFDSFYDGILENFTGGPTPRPDYSGALAFSRSAAASGNRDADRLASLARDQYNRDRSYYTRLSNQFNQLGGQLGGAAGQTLGAYTGTFLPQYRGLSQDANYYSSNAYQDEMAGQARADVETAFGQARDTLRRDLASLGRPGGSRYGARSRGLALAEAAQKARAATQARTSARDTGFQARTNVANIGADLAAPAYQFGTGAIGAYGGAGEAFGIPGARFSDNMHRSAQIRAAGYGTAVPGVASITGSQAGAFAQTYQNPLDTASGIAGLIQGLA